MMKNKAFVIVLAVAFIICVFAGCSSENKESNENNTIYSSETSDNENNATEKQNPSSDSGKSDKPDTSNESQDTDAHAENNSKSDTVKVIFKDEDGNVLKSDEIEKGEDAVPPEEPKKDGHKFIGWNYDYEDVQTDITVVPVFEEITEPSLMTESVTAQAGDKIDVAVSVLNNPGFLGAVLNIQYDETALSLTGVSNGSVMKDYVFTPPKNMKSDCNAAWNSNDIPDSELNGEIMVLHFKISNKAKAGDYSVSASCLSNAFDESYNPFSFDSISGIVKIK